MSEENAIRVIEDQPEAAAIEVPHEAGRDRGGRGKKQTEKSMLGKLDEL
jgi:hypothetical protein